jgi:hypothetical protein
VESARIVNALMSIVQFHEVHKGSWDFDGAEEAFPRYTAFLEPLCERARHFVRERYFKYAWDPLPTLVQGLLIGARALGVEGSTRDTHVAIVSALLAEAPPEDATHDEQDDATGWRAFTRLLRQCRTPIERDGLTHPSWRDHLLNLVGARQGGGTSVYALDVLRMKSALEATLEHWAIDPPAGSAAGSVDFPSFRMHAQEIRRRSSAIELARQQLIDWRKKTLDWLGEDFDKAGVIRELEETVQAIRDAGLLSAPEARDYAQLVESFRNARVKEALADANKVVDDANRGTVLTVLGRNYGATISSFDTLMTRFDELATRIERQIGSEMASAGESPVAEALTLLSDELRQSITAVEEVKSLGLN